jgi:curved DNA-binding protein CbpA
MTQISFSTAWLKLSSDPYAVLGVSVSADDRRVLKRYHTLAKLLHPDVFVNAEPEAAEIAHQVLSRLINPAYQELKQEKGRAEVLARLRMEVRAQAREALPAPSTPQAQALLDAPSHSVDTLYEQAIATLAEIQYQALTKFPAITTHLLEVNAVYLYVKNVKIGEPSIREKRTGVIPVTASRPFPTTPPGPPATSTSSSTPSYAERHYQRAQEYLKKRHWSMAVQELRDAIRLEADRSDCHTLLAIAYYMQNLPGMAKVHCRQALKLDPQNQLARRYAPKLGISAADFPSQTNGQGSSPPSSKAKGNNGSRAGSTSNGRSPAPRRGLFGLFGK